MKEIQTQQISKVLVEPVAFRYKINIKDDFVNVDDYQEVIDCVEGATSADHIDVRLETDGGSLQVALQIIDALNCSDAYKTVAVQGGTASAGTMVLFGVNWNEVFINPLAEIMVHQASYGFKGKHTSNKNYTDFSEKLLNKTFDHFYSDILTEEHFAQIANERDVFLTGEEVTELMKIAVEKAQTEQENLEDETEIENTPQE